MNDENATIGGPLNFENLFSSAVVLFKSPRTYFRSMEKSGGYVTPILYALAWLAISGVVSMIVSFIRPAIAVPPAFRILELFLGPLAGVVFGFVLAAVFFVIWHLMGSKEDYQTAFRVWAFTTPVAVVGSLLGLVPFLDGIVIVYGVYLLIIASQEVHGLSRERSWAVWGGVGGLLLLFLLVFLAVGLAMRSRGAFPGSGMTPSYGFPRSR